MEEALARITGSAGLSSNSNIERLLQAIALRQNGYGEKTASATDNRYAEIVVALDAIASWIGRAEKRLGASPVSNESKSAPIIRALAAVTARIEMLGRQVAALPGTSASIIAAITDISLETEQLRTSLAEKASREKLSELADHVAKQSDVSSEVSAKLHLLEQRLAALEQRLPARDNLPLQNQFSVLAERLDSHLRSDARSATSAIRYFELMAEKIEGVGNEIRQLKKERTANAAMVKLLPALMTKLEELHACKHAVSELDTRLSSMIEAPSTPADLPERIEHLSGQVAILQQEKATFAAEINALKSSLEQSAGQRNKNYFSFPSVTEQLRETINSLQANATDQPGDQIPHSRYPAEESDNSGSLQIRAGFIAAARRATRSEDMPGAYPDSPQQAELPQPTIGRRFLRAATGGQL